MATFTFATSDLHGRGHGVHQKLDLLRGLLVPRWRSSEKTRRSLTNFQVVDGKGDTAGSTLPTRSVVTWRGIRHLRDAATAYTPTRRPSTRRPLTLSLLYCRHRRGGEVNAGEGWKGGEAGEVEGSRGRRLWHFARWVTRPVKEWETFVRSWAPIRGSSVTTMKWVEGVTWGILTGVIVIHEGVDADTRSHKTSKLRKERDRGHRVYEKEDSQDYLLHSIGEKWDPRHTGKLRWMMRYSYKTKQKKKRKKEPSPQ